MAPIHVVLTPTAYAILGLLRRQPMHGYEIAQHFKPETDLGQVVPADMSTIYTLLKDLQEHGLISGKRETVGARPPRTVFSPTAEAEELFFDWVRRPVARIREVRLDFLLKLYFAQQLGPAEVKALVEAQLAVGHSYLARQKATARTLAPSSFEALVLESKMTAAESTLSWLKRLATQVVRRKLAGDRTRHRSGKKPRIRQQTTHSGGS
jgi:DNA-binding PadR family transcriptional regulator